MISYRYEPWKNRDQPRITLEELEHNVIETGIYWLCGSYSITAGCHHDAAIALLAHARELNQSDFDRKEMEIKLNQAYRFFEFQEDLPWSIPDVDNDG